MTNFHIAALAEKGEGIVTQCVKSEASMEAKGKNLDLLA
jgi:hypothetical protein